MGCESNNATAPTCAIADGAQALDPARVARDLVGFGPGGMDPRVREIIPGFDAPFFQAGLAGYSDAAMRIIARRHGCPLCVTEALLDRTLLAGGRGFAKADLGELHDNVPGGEDDHPLAGQIMGSDPGEMAAAAIKMVEQGSRRAKEYRKFAEGGAIGNGQLAIERGSAAPALAASPSSCDPIANCQLPIASFQALDINLACPVKKIARKARGGHWLPSPTAPSRSSGRARRVARERSRDLKIRRSYDDTPEMARNFMRIFDAAYDMGYAWATVHARTVQQKYVGPSRWDLLRDIVGQRPGRVVFGSGDIWKVEDIFRMIGYTGVSGVSVARGCIGNPWIFRQARAMMAGEEPRPPTIAEQRQVLEDHFELALRVNASMRDPEHHTGKTMRKFAIRFAAHHPDGDEVKRAFVAASSFDEWRAVLESWYT